MRIDDMVDWRLTIIGIGMLAVVLISGCTAPTNLTGRDVIISGLTYDTFTSTLTGANCNGAFLAQYPSEKNYSCVITQVNLQAKTFDCKCTIKGVV
jgi:hypothetical protein